LPTDFLQWFSRGGGCGSLQAAIRRRRQKWGRGDWSNKGDIMHLTTFGGSKIAVLPGTDNPRYAAESAALIFFI